MKQSQILSLALIIFGLFYTNCFGLPVLESIEHDQSDDSDNDNGNVGVGVELLPDGFGGFNFTGRNDTARNLYVVKAVVYEIGILTETDENDTSLEDDTHERVDLTFFDAHKNESHIDLGRIPLPVQTNVTGQVLTGLAPVNIGAFSNPSELLESLPLTGTIVNITHSDTAYFKLTVSNRTDQEKPHILKADDLTKLPQIANVLPKIPSSTLLNSTNEITDKVKDNSI